MSNVCSRVALADSECDRTNDMDDSILYIDVRICFT
jgi:hypothetical protein